MSKEIPAKPCSEEENSVRLLYTKSPPFTRIDEFSPISELIDLATPSITCNHCSLSADGGSVGLSDIDCHFVPSAEISTKSPFV